MAPSASFMAQKRRKAMAFRLTSRLWGLLVKAIRQFTQSVNVVTYSGRTSVSLEYSHHYLLVGGIDPNTDYKATGNCPGHMQ